MDVPEYMDELRASVRVSPDPEKDSITLDVSVISGSVTLLQAFGPASIVLTHSFTNIQTAVGLVTNTFNSTQHFLFAANFTVRNNVQVVHLNFIKNQRPVFAFMFDTSSPQSDVTVINTSLTLPVYIKFEAAFRVTPWVLSLNFNSLLLPGLRKAMGKAQYVRLSGKASGQMWWESQRGHVDSASAQVVFIQNERHQPWLSIL